MAQAEGPDGYDDELARIDASIAALKIRDLAAAAERSQIASKIQAAQFQRDILAHANQQKAKKKAPRRLRRRPVEEPPARRPGERDAARRAGERDAAGRLGEQETAARRAGEQDTSRSLSEQGTARRAGEAEAVRRGRERVSTGAPTAPGRRPGPADDRPPGDERRPGAVGDPRPEGRRLEPIDDLPPPPAPGAGDRLVDDDLPPPPGPRATDPDDLPPPPGPGGSDRASDDDLPPPPPPGRPRPTATRPTATGPAAGGTTAARQSAARTAGAPAGRERVSAARADRGPGSPPGAPPWSAPGTPYSGAPGVATDGVTALVDDPPPTEHPSERRAGPPPRRRPPADAPPAHEPEASSQSVQNILLALGALLVAAAAVVYAGAVTNPFGRAAVLATATALALAFAPGVARRGLTSTAETVAGVGLVLLPMSVYALHGSSLFGGSGVPVALFLGVTFLITAVVAFVYSGATRLSAPRYATVVAVQPVPPLLAYPLVESPAGWGLALAAVAIVDLLLLTTVIRRGPLVPRWPFGRPGPGDRESMADADARDIGAADFEREGAYDDELVARPESLPEEPDLIIPGLSGARRRRWLPTRIFGGPRPEGAPPAGSVPLAPPDQPPAARWLRELTFFLLCVAVGASLLYAGGALAGADTVPDAFRSGLILILAAVTASAAAHLLDQLTARNIAGAVLTLAVIAAAARVAAVASPHWTLAAAAAAVAITGAVVIRIPDEVRRGPQLASAAALSVIGLFVAVAALRAALAPVQAARPVWHADTAGYASSIAEAAGPAGWLLALSALLLTVAAALALPAGVRHEGAVAGVALTALAVPASLGLPWAEAPWPLVLAAIGLGAAGLMAGTRRIAVAHISAAAVVGLFGAGAALSAVWLTAAVLTALAGAGVMVAIAAHQIPLRLYAWMVGDWASGAAALAIPGAAVTAVLAAAGPDDSRATVPALAFGFVAVAATLTYAAVFQVARREISLPLTAGTGLGAVALALAAIFAPGATAPDVWVGSLLLAAAGLLFFAKSIDTNRRADRMLDGPDVAAAAATVAICGALARVGALAFPGAPLVIGAVMVLAVGLGIRLLPLDWRRGPVRGLALAGLVVGGIAGWQALSGGVRILAAPGPLWNSDLSGFPVATGPGGWQAPVALLLIAAASAAALPRPAKFDVGAVCVTLATIGAPAAFGLPWWSPILIGGAVALGYGLASVAATDPRAALARAAVATVVSLHFVGAGLVRPWSTAFALALVATIALLVAALSRSEVAPVPQRADSDGDEDALLARDDTGMPRHRTQIGGAATFGLLLALPGVLAAASADQGRSTQVVLLSALAASGLSLAALALAGRLIPQYLPWATFGLVGGATVTALASVPSDHPTALYAAAAALLGVVAELLRGSITAPGLTVAPNRFWAEGGYVRPRWTAVRPSGLRGRWLVDPATGAVVVAILPTLVALVSLAPALNAALFDPLEQVGSIWRGPVAALTQPGAGMVDGTSVLAAVLLTAAAALAALGFGGRPAETVPVILPGLAVTLLITPIALRMPWPASTTAALLVFTIAMLALAFTPPPVRTRAGLLRGTRTVVFVIGLLAGGAGLAGALAERTLTLFTVASAVLVGLAAAVAGRTRHARILGWLFAAVMAQFLVLTVALVAGLAPEWAAFGVLAVGAALLILEAALPRLGLPAYAMEARTVEWSGYASALLAGALAYRSPEHLAAMLAAWGAVLGLAASRPGRTPQQRRNLFWLAVAFEIVGWWLFMSLSDVALPEAYTLPFAALALLVGYLESRHRPELSSWSAYGPALLAAFVPTIGIVMTTDAGDLREVLLLLGAVATLIVGSRLQQQAPVVVGAAATAVAALHFASTLVGPWLVLVPLGVVLLFLGATNENRRRTQERFKGALGRMR